MKKTTKSKASNDSDSRMPSQTSISAANSIGDAWTWRDVTITWRDVRMGVDVVGGQYNYRISGTGPDGQRYMIRMGSVREWGALALLLESYHVHRCVIDSWQTRTVER